MEPRFGGHEHVMLVNRGKDNVTTGKTFCEQENRVKLVEMSQSLVETSDVVSSASRTRCATGRAGDVVKSYNHGNWSSLARCQS